MTKKPDLSARVRLLLKHYTRAEIVAEMETQEAAKRGRGRPVEIQDGEAGGAWVLIEYLRRRQGLTTAAARAELARLSKANPGAVIYSEANLKALRQRALYRMKSNPTVRAELEAWVTALLEKNLPVGSVLLPLRQHGPGKK